MYLHYGLGTEDFKGGGLRVVPADFDLDDDGAFDDLSGRIACKYSGKDKPINESLRANSVGVSEAVSVAEQTDTARCIHFRMARRRHGWAARSAFQVGSGNGSTTRNSKLPFGLSTVVIWEVFKFHFLCPGHLASVMHLVSDASGHPMRRAVASMMAAMRQRQMPQTLPAAISTVLSTIAGSSVTSVLSKSYSTIPPTGFSIGTFLLRKSPLPDPSPSP